MRRDLRLSYAQNFEDILLDRVFGRQSSGFYIDVGAGDPERYSLTRRLYDAGWSGVNIEPDPLSYQRLVEARPRDVNVQVVVGDGLAHAAPSLSAAAAGGARPDRETPSAAIAATTLAAICERHAPAQIDFLKINADGAEAQVLAGADFVRFRPRLLIVRSPAPDIGEPQPAAWEPLVLGAGYRFAYADGLSRFYVRAGDEDLLVHFAHPPGIFDFDPYELFAAASYNVKLKEQLAETSSRLAEAQQLLLLLRKRGWLPRALRPRLGIHRQSLPHTVGIPDAYRQEPVPRNAPTMSIVTPVFNQGTFIGATLDSVLKQNYPRLEYFVRDGGSLDGTVEEIVRREDALTGWYSGRDGGQAAAINAGFEQSSGEIMAWLNGDDLLLPGALNYVGNYFSKHPDVDLVYGHRILIDENGREIGRWILPRHDRKVLKWADFIPQETLFWRRRVWERIGPIDASFNYTLDWDFLLRAQEAGFRFRRLPRFIGAFRIHPAQKTTKDEMVGAAESSILRRRYLKREPSGREIRHAIRGYLFRHVVLHRAYRLKLIRY